MKNLLSLTAAALFAVSLGCTPPASEESVDLSTDVAETVDESSNTTMGMETPGSNITTGMETPAGETP